MLIHLTKSKLFTEEPAIRFSKEYQVDAAIWRELWKRKQLLDYTSQDLREYFEFKTGRLLTPQSLSRWLFRNEVFVLTNGVMKKGVRVVQSEFFKQYEEAVVKELLRGMRFSEVKEPRTLA